MKVLNLKYLSLACIVAMTVLSCAQRRVNGHYDFPTECLSRELDGSNTLLVYADGRNRFDAVEQAKKKAIRDVLFAGINNGKGGCDIRPLLPEVNAERKYENYFASFFKDDGKYMDYISMDEERRLNRVFRKRFKGRKEVKYGVVVRVKVTSLREKLIKDKILITE